MSKKPKMSVRQFIGHLQAITQEERKGQNYFREGSDELERGSTAMGARLMKLSGACDRRAERRAQKLITAYVEAVGTSRRKRTPKGAE